MYTEILIPLDGSPLAEEVLPYAQLFATAFEIPMELLCVVDPETVSAEGSDALENACRESSSYLEGIAGSLTGRVSVPVHRTVEKGDPAERIAAAASARKNPFIAMSTHGRSGVQRWLLGSVAETRGRYGRVYGQDGNTHARCHGGRVADCGWRPYPDR
jgi:nucleotide-binding universal stress UspA family protein